MANLQAELARFEAELAGTSGQPVRDRLFLGKGTVSRRDWHPWSPARGLLTGKSVLHCDIQALQAPLARLPPPPPLRPGVHQAGPSGPSLPPQVAPSYPAAPQVCDASAWSSRQVHAPVAHPLVACRLRRLRVTTMQSSPPQRTRHMCTPARHSSSRRLRPCAPPRLCSAQWLWQQHVHGCSPRADMACC